MNKTTASAASILTAAALEPGDVVSHAHFTSPALGRVLATPAQGLQAGYVEVEWRPDGSWRTLPAELVAPVHGPLARVRP